MKISYILVQHLLLLQLPSLAVGTGDTRYEVSTEPGIVLDRTIAAIGGSEILGVIQGLTLQSS